MQPLPALARGQFGAQHGARQAVRLAPPDARPVGGEDLTQVSPAVVKHDRSVFRVRVGDDEDARPPMQRTDGEGLDDLPLRSVTDVAQIAEHAVETTRKQRSDVLGHDPLRPQLFDEALHLRPQPGALSVEALPEPGERQVLAREAAAEDLDGLDENAAQLAHVGEAWNVRPACGEHGPAVRVRLAVPRDGPELRALEPEFQAADAGEERADAGHSASSCSGCLCSNGCRPRRT